MQSREWDLLHGAAFDLSSMQTARVIAGDIAAGRVAALMLAPPCSSFSIARTRTSPLRSLAFPWGLPTLRGKGRLVAEAGSQALRVVFRILRAAERHHVPWVLEQPRSSCMLKVPEWNSCLWRGHVELVDVDQCMFGTPWRKATRFVCSRVAVDALQARTRCLGPAGICYRTGTFHHHIDWTTSRHAAEYPSALARAIARALRASIAEQRFNRTTALQADREHSSSDALGS